MKREIELKVGEAPPNDEGKGIVRLHDESMEALGLKIGDTVEITGKRTTGAIVGRAYPSDEKEIIRMDRITRENLEVSVGDKVRVGKIEPEAARKAVFAPEQKIAFSTGFGDFIKKRVMGRPVKEGDKVLIHVLDMTLPFLIIQTFPKGIVRISENTNVKVVEFPAEIIVVKGPTIDRETNKLKITVETPGIEKEDLKINATECTVALKAKIAGREYLKVLPLGIRIKPDTGKAVYNDGVVEITFGFEETPKEVEVTFRKLIKNR